MQENGSGALDMRGMRNLVKSLPQYRCDPPILLGEWFVGCLSETFGRICSPKAWGLLQSDYPWQVEFVVDPLSVVLTLYALPQLNHQLHS